MNIMSRTITGIAMIVGGLILIGVSFYLPFLLIYGIPSLVIGVFILLNKKEDVIEQIKGERRKK